MDDIKEEKSGSIFGFLITSFTVFFAILIFTISIIIFHQIKKQSDSLFDYQMQVSAKVLETVFKIYPTLEAKQENIIFDNMSKSFLNVENYNENVAIRVYNPKNKKLILKTSNLPYFEKSDMQITQGFERIYTILKGGQKKYWYTYTLTADNGDLITIFINDAVKDKISHSVIVKALGLLILTYLFLVAFTYYILSLALRPLKRINKKVSRLNPRSNDRLDMDETPQEIMPFVQQINSLIDKFQNILEREKRFSGDAAHELKTPIAGLRTQVQIALTSNDLVEIKEKLKKVLNSADRYSHIIDQLLTLSRIQPNEQISFAKKLGINRAIETALADVAIKAIEKNINLIFNPYKKELYCQSNDYLINILVKNLISNSIKYTEPNGSVEVTTYLKDKSIMITVKDTGIGVPKESLTRIFDRFYRETGTKQEGSGLGLAIVSEIVRLHNGEVYAENNQDKGITVTVRIPLINN